MNGLGDTIYHRPFARDLARRAFLETRWPDLFSDLRFLRTRPKAAPTLRARYSTKTLVFTTVPGAIARAFPEPTEYRFDLPRWPSRFLHLPAYAVVRAPTLRDDFRAPARNPDSRYLAQAVQALRGGGFFVVGVAKVGPGECFDGEPPPVDLSYWDGLPVPDLMALIAGAAVVVAGPGWTVPAAMAYRVPHVIVHGGAAKWNALHKLIDPRMGTMPVAEVIPDRFCRDCKSVEHDCDKTISDFPRRFFDAFNLAMRLRFRRL